jgi:hypothetical protein
MRRLVLILITVSTIPVISYGQEFIEDRPIPKTNSLGVGLGMPYGGIGVNANINLVPNLYLTAGLGTTVFAGVGYCAGARFFFTPANQSFRPRASAFFGITTIVEKEYPNGETDDESYAGAVLGIGSQWMWGRTKSNGLDFDLLYIAYSEYEPEDLRAEGFIPVDESSDFKFSIGYRRAF